MSSLPLTLFGHLTPSIADEPSVRRLQLDESCWVDHGHQMLLGADSLLCELEESMSWYRGQRLMYGNWLPEPRLTSHEAKPGVPIPNTIDSIRVWLDGYYGQQFAGLFCNYYRDGSDSVAWHADAIGRASLNPLVAIVSLGGPRTFQLRPKGGGATTSIVLASGDLLVMGGATQHRWEHAVLKTAAASPRMSVTMRAGCRDRPTPYEGAERATPIRELHEATRP